MAEPVAPSQRSVVVELVVHAVAFCVAAGIGATVLSRHYVIFEHTLRAQARRATPS